MAEAYVVLPLVAFIINMFLAGLVLRSDWYSFRHRVFAAFLVAMALWGLTVFGVRSSPNPNIAYQWQRAAVVIIAFVGPLFYHFSIRFTNTRASTGALPTFYGLAALTGVLTLWGVVLTGTQLKFYGYAPVLGPAFALFLVTSYVPSLGALFVLTRAHKRSRVSEEKNRLTYVVIGAWLVVIGGTTDYLPALGIRIYPLGMLAGIIFGILTTIAMTRYRLMDLRLLLRRGFVYLLLSGSVFAIYGVALFLFARLFQYQVTSTRVFAVSGALVLVAVLLPLAMGRVQRFVDRMFFRQRYDHLVVLRQFTLETQDIGDFAALAKSLTRTVIMAMQAHWVALLTPHPESGDFVVAEAGADGQSPQISVRQNSILAKWLSRREQALSIRSLDTDPYLQAMGDALRDSLQSSGTHLLVPMKSKGKLTGILALGPKLTEEDYSPDSMDLLTVFTSQTATLIENSRLYTQEMARLRELEQLGELKSNLLRTVSHELKSPVTAIKTSVDLLSAAGEDLAERQRARLMRALRSGVDRLERLVQESLDYAEMQSVRLQLRLEPTDMADVVRGALDLVMPTARSRHQQVTVAVPPELPKVMVDQQRVERILLNLLTNATRFTPEGGEISVRARREGLEMVVEVADNGPGISEEEQKFVFNEYYRGSSADRHATSGAGLGLAIAKYLAELHGGRIGVRSQVGVGSTFFFAIPIAPTQGQKPESHPDTPEGGPSPNS